MRILPMEVKAGLTGNVPEADAPLYKATDSAAGQYFQPCKQRDKYQSDTLTILKG